MLENKYQLENSETQDEGCLYQTRIEEIKTKATQVEGDDLNCKKREENIGIWGEN